MNVYLDHNASTPVRTEVIDAMVDVMSRVGNPSSVHAHGQMSRKAVERSRSQIGKAVSARAEDVIFTSGGTEAANLALHSAIQSGGVKRLIVSALEHSCVEAFAQQSGLPVEIMPVDGNGVVDLGWLEQRLSHWDVSTDGVPFLALMMVNNEIGTIQPVSEAVRLIHQAEGLIFVDAIQAVGKIPVDFALINADYMALSGHKFGGPQGMGALIARCDASVSAHHHGGGQEKGRRPGTENLTGIVGLGLAAELAVADLGRFADLADWRDEIIASLRKIAPEIIILGEAVERLPNTISLSVPGWTRENQVMALDLEGVSISAGSACSSGKTKGSKIGAAIGLDETSSNSVVRISLGWNSTPDDVEKLITAWKQAYARVAPSLKLSA